MLVPIQGHEEYGITEDGIVINLKSGKEVKAEVVRGGLKRLRLDGERAYVHRLVAETYIPNPENKKYVLHKDYDKENNNIDNLVWSNGFVPYRESEEFKERRAYLGFQQ